jgi:hypothetical protein
MGSIKQGPQTAATWDPLSTIVTMRLSINGVSKDIPGVVDSGADFTSLFSALMTDFKVDPDKSGYIETEVDPNGNVLATTPLVMATAMFEGREFPMGVVFHEERSRPNLFGRSGLMEHFKIEFDPASATTTFTWADRGPRSTIDEVDRLIDSELANGPTPQG